MKKYKLRLDLKLELGHVTLYRIEKRSNGQLGGYIEKESNLSQVGDAWVSGNARVSGDAQVSGDAWVSGNARVSKIDEIVNFVVAFSFSITITPQNIAIGCKLKTRREWLRVTKKQAVEMGLKAELYPKYKALIKAGMAMVPEAKQKRR